MQFAVKGKQSLTFSRVIEDSECKEYQYLLGNILYYRMQ